MTRAAFDPSLWQEVEGYLDHALALQPEERADWLAELAAQHPRTAHAVHELLVQREILNDSGFLRGSPLTSTTLASLPVPSMAGTRIGLYTIERLLGHGGMADVWLGRRNDGRFGGHCAIKLIDGAVAQPALAERLRNEGRLMARLAHPNIARLLDAGETADGKVFLVLEYIEGEHIDRYCESGGLDVDARVRLFLDAASAVAHAHSHCIVHRDLKPSNVLVTRHGVVKLLDFGIAKLQKTGQVPDDGAMTRVEEIALTPEYAAPEQLLGETPSPATDVYQLGMLLYVLLAGKHPLQRSGTRAERIKAALSGQVPRVSQLVRGRLRKKLRGDVDAILATALHPDPRRRYPTASALQDELIRYLLRRPVSARRG